MRNLVLFQKATNFILDRVGVMAHYKSGVGHAGLAEVFAGIQLAVHLLGPAVIAAFWYLMI